MMDTGADMVAEAGLAIPAVVFRAVEVRTSAAAMKAISITTTTIAEEGIITAVRAFHSVSTEHRITGMGLAMLMAPDCAAITINGVTGYPLPGARWDLTDIRYRR